MTSSVDKIAGRAHFLGRMRGAGWGYQLPPARVLTEMAQVGLAATEFARTVSCPPTRRSTAAVPWPPAT